MAHATYISDSPRAMSLQHAERVARLADIRRFLASMEKTVAYLDSSPLSVGLCNFLLDDAERITKEAKVLAQQALDARNRQLSFEFGARS